MVDEQAMAEKEKHKDKVKEEIAKEKADYESDEEEEKPIERLPFPEDNRQDIGDLTTSIWAQRFHTLLSSPDDESKFYELACLAHDKHPSPLLKYLPINSLSLSLSRVIFSICTFPACS